ncbi:MAG: VOC family protein [Oligoflexales bacterium]|nr:VOC family protein [Oligoflexales bacterium]
MSKPWKPENHPSMSPFIITADAKRLIAFLQTAFEGKVSHRFDLPDGTVMHAEVRIHDSIGMFGEAGEEWMPVWNSIHLYVKDVDTTFKRAINAGATSVQEPKQKDGESDKRGGVKDQDGNTWWIASQK